MLINARKTADRTLPIPILLSNIFPARFYLIRDDNPLRLTTLLFFNYDRQFNYSFVEESRLRRATFRNRYRYIHIYPEISPPDTS